MGIYEALSWKREASEPSEELAELVRSHPEIFHSDLRIDPPTTIERYGNPRYRFALGSIFLARSRYTALELQDSFNFGPR